MHARRTVAGRVVLITGAARGIGAELAGKLADGGAKLALLDVDEEEVERIATSVGGGAIAIAADVTDVASLERGIEAAVARFGGIDVAVANAGTAVLGTVAAVNPAIWERNLEINLHGVWRTARMVLPHLIESRGYLLNVGSIATFVPFPGASAYAASKAGVEAFSNSLRLEVAHLGVDVGVAYFSFISTPLVRGFEERAAFRVLRASAPRLLRNTYPVDLAADALVRGIAERSRRVYAPGWLRWLLLARGFFSNRIAERSLMRGAPEVVSLADAEGAASALLPPGYARKLFEVDGAAAGSRGQGQDRSQGERYRDLCH
jgi:NAD(P)-dependent dehydrogenase (short-subunit alcohol dehydrogenase family)